MKVLMIDKYYFVKGGAERYMIELSDILQANGHEIIPFAMQHEDNFETPYSEHFVSNVDYNGLSSKDWPAFLHAAGRMIYSFEAKRRLELLIEKTKPDIAHLHMIDHQLSPSILHALKKYDVPVIQTVHQYKLVCPNYRLYNPRTGKVCQKCLSGNMLNPITEKCHKNSTVAGIAIALESTFHRKTGIYEKNTDIFHVPSHFMGNKLVEGGVRRDKIRHLFYTIELSHYPPNIVEGDYALFFGRLADEKGIITLLKAMEKCPDVPLYIVGGGPQEPVLKKFIADHKLENVKMLGLKSGEELQSLVQNCRMVVVPSEWYDNSPLVIYESFAYGKPVIGAKMGGISELIDHEENGLHFEAGNIEELTAAMRKLWDDPALAKSYGKAAHEKAEREFDPQVHYEKIHEWYQEMLHGASVLV